MAEDWAANVKKYVPDADDGIITGIVRYCGIALQKRDSSLVSFGDPSETKRVRENFLKKKLALTQTDDMLDEAIAAVGLRMKGKNFRNRVTVYYLLSEHFGMLAKFAKAAKAPAAAKRTTGATKAAAGAAAAGLASLAASESPAEAAEAGASSSDADDAKDTGGVVGAAGTLGAAALGAAGAVAAGAVTGAKAVGETAADAVGSAGAAVAGATGAAAQSMGSVAASAGAGIGSAASGAAHALTGGHSDNSDDGKSGWGWLIWLLLAALVIGVLWWLFHGKPAADNGAAAENTAAAVAASDAASAPPPAEGTVAIPTGAGVTTETRDGKPVVKVYFETGKTDVVPAFAAAATGLKAYLDGHAGSTLAVSGYNDKTGNAAANAALSKSRAQAVKAALVTSGVADTSVALVKPADTTGTKVDNAAARRVEVVVQ